MEDEGVFGIYEALHAEAAADIMGDDADLLGGDVEHVLGEDVADADDALAADGEGVAMGGVELAECGADFHGGRCNAVLDDAQAGDMGGGREGGAGGGAVPDLPVEELVGAGLGPDEGGLRIEGGLDGGGGGEVGVIDLDGVDAGAGGFAGFGDDEGHLVPDEADTVLGQHGARRQPVLAAQGHEAGDGAVVGDVLVGVDGDDAGDGQRGHGVDAADLGMAIGGAQDGAVEHAGRGHVIGVAAFALEEAGVFDTLGGLAGTELHERDSIAL